MSNNYLKILEKLISIDSNFLKSNQQIVDFIAHLFKKSNRYKITIQKIKRENYYVYNLIIKLSGKNSKKPLVLAGHSDTVPDNSQWHRNPWQATITKNKVYGLGATDMKGALALMIKLLLSIVQKPKHDIYLTITADEEGMGLGISHLLQKLKIKNADIVIGESTNGKLRLGQKAVLSYKIIISGPSQHAAYISLKENLQTNPVQLFDKLNQKLTTWAVQNSKKHPVYGGLTYNIGLIHGGTNANSLPAELMAEFEFRFPPLTIFKDLDKLHRSILQIVDKILKDSHYKIERTFNGGFFETSNNSQLVKKLQLIAQQTLGRQLDYFTGMGWTEASVYQQFGDVVILGPGTVNQQHKPDEYVELKNLEKVYQIYSVLVKQP